MKRVVALVALATIAAASLWPSTEPPVASTVDNPGVSAETHSSASSVPWCGESPFVSANVEDRMVASPAPDSDVPDPTTLDFELTGAPENECRGIAEVCSWQGDHVFVPITGSRLRVPFEGLQRIEFAVEGFCVWIYDGPFVARDEPVRVELRRAGTVLVRVLDDTGALLPDRLVYCFAIGASELQEKHGHRTTTWATTDHRGLARIDHVIPGTHTLDTAAVAEWRDATVRGVTVHEGLVTSCDLVATLLRPDQFGGFTMPVASMPFVDFTAPGEVDHYRFCTADGQWYELRHLAGTVRCIVPGRAGDVVLGRIQRLEGGRPAPASKQSDGIEVTIGAVVPITVRWADVPLR